MMVQVLVGKLDGPAKVLLLAVLDFSRARAWGRRSAGLLEFSASGDCDVGSEISAVQGVWVH